MIFDEETTKSIFEQYIGQDVWIKCDNRYKHQVMFARVRRVEPDNWGGYIAYVDSVMDYSISEFIYTTGRISITDGTGWAVVDPLEVYSTDELFGINTDYNRKVFNRFDGTTYWVLITKPDGYLQGNYYIQCMLDSLGRVPAVPENQVTDFSLETADTYVPPENSPSMVKISLDNIKVSDPLEVLSDEELREMLEQNQQLWEDWFGDEGEDY